jgi:virulence-associated protein VagC
MPEITIAKIYREGRKQNVRIPQQFHFQGNRLHIRRLRGAILLEPIFSSFDQWISAMDRSQGAYMPEGRFQPETPIRKVFV